MGIQTNNLRGSFRTSAPLTTQVSQAQCYKIQDIKYRMSSMKCLSQETLPQGPSLCKPSPQLYRLPVSQGSSGDEGLPATLWSPSAGAGSSRTQLEKRYCCGYFDKILTFFLQF